MARAGERLLTAAEEVALAVRVQRGDRAAGRELVERARDAGAMAYLVKPFSKADLVPAIEMATSRYDELRALEHEVADLQQRFETRKIVDRAKGLLQAQLGMTEPAAFRWIQKTSMDRRMTMKAVAEAVVAASS